MNEDLANYLLWVVSDPQRLADFNNAALRNDMIDHSGLPEEDQAALRGNDVSAILGRFMAGPGDLTWVLVPVTAEAFAFGLGVMTPRPPPPPLRLAPTGTRAKKVTKRKSAKRKTAKSRKPPKRKGRG
jgi:hypothetical protein